MLLALSCRARGVVEGLEIRTERRQYRWGSRIDYCRIEPQALMGQYRVDFLLTLASAKAPVQPSIVIECDGFRYHERTPAQASRDRARDRALQTAGHLVFRFIGADIWRDAPGCAEEALRALLDRRSQSGVMPAKHLRAPSIRDDATALNRDASRD